MPSLRQSDDDLAFQAGDFRLSSADILVWTPEILQEFRRVRSSLLRSVSLAERLERVRQEVSQGQNRFRLVYGTTVCFEESHAGADCQFINEPHFHRRVKRIGHLPMFTVKELPE